MSLPRAFTVLWTANAASNLADGLAFVSMPLLAASLTDDPRLVAGLVLLCAVFALVGTMESVADNAAVSLVPSLAHPSDLDRANARISAAQLLADEFLGPPLGGFLFALTAAAPIFTEGGFWAASGTIALALPVRRQKADMDFGSREAPVWREAVVGTRWLLQNRTVRSLALIGGLASVGYMFPFSILVLFVQRQLNLGDVGYGAILAASALGGLIGSVLTARIRASIGYRWTIVASLATGAASLLALALTRNPFLAAVLLAAYICHAVVWGICAISLRQRLVPDELRGRVNASSHLIGLIGLTLGSAIGGGLALVHIALPVAAGGVVFAVCSVIAMCLIRPDAAVRTGRLPEL